MKKCLILLLFSSILIQIFPVNAEQQTSINDNGLAFVTMEQIPYGFSTEEGKTKGVLYDILNEIINIAEIDDENVLMPTKRIVSMITANNKLCTLVAGTPSNNLLFDMIEPIDYILKAGFLPKAGIKLTDYSSLKGRIIAVPLGINFDEKFHNDKTLTKVHPPQYLHGIRMLKANRVDVVAGAISNLQYIAKLEGMKANELGKPLIITQSPVYLTCSYSISSSMRTTLKKAVITLKNNGKISKILNNYFSVDAKQTLITQQ